MQPDAMGAKAASCSLQAMLTLKTNCRSRVAMSLMRHSDRRLTDKIYKDENLLGTWGAFDILPNYSERASQIASLILGVEGQSVSSAVATASGNVSEKTIASIGLSHVLTLPDAMGREQRNGGSGGARTRNLCRDRAAL
jgi:hypothetical protein